MEANSPIPSEHPPVGEELFGAFEEGEAVVGDEVSEVVLVVVVLVLLLPTVEVDAVVVETGVSDQSHPLGPARGDVFSIVLVQVLPKESWEEGESQRSESEVGGWAHSQLYRASTSVIINISYILYYYSQLQSTSSNLHYIPRVKTKAGTRVSLLLHQLCAIHFLPASS